MPKPRHNLEPLHPQYDLLCSVQDIRDTVRAQRVLMDKIEKQLVALIDEIKGN
jgi:uncharacterized coiled-coil protein SlyX